jgi:hypothetical protein
LTYSSGSQGQNFVALEQRSGGRWGSIAGYCLAPLVPKPPSGRKITPYRSSSHRENLPCAGNLLSPASSPISPRRAGTVPWYRGGCRTWSYQEHTATADQLMLRQLISLPICIHASFLRLLPHSWDLVPSKQGCVKKTHVTAVAARSLTRSRRRRRSAPRLASCLSRTGSGSREFPAPPTRRCGGNLQDPRHSRVHSEPAIRGICRHAPSPDSIYHSGAHDGLT